MSKNAILLESQYLAPVQYYAKLVQYPKVYIEKHEHFIKSSYRNRCYLASPDGPLRLSVPLKHGKSNERKTITEVKIFHGNNWRHKHWQSLCSIYRTTPYFEFYEDRFEPFYEKEYEYLFDFNEDLLEFILSLLDIEVDIEYTKSFEKDPPDDIRDFRSGILPHTDKGKPDPDFTPPRYKQIFEDRTGFLPNMSIVDLLYNKGPDTIQYLREAVGKGKVGSDDE
jgi:hypothetical protein